jgi:hypothetical protein
MPLTLDIVTSAHDAAAHLERDVDVVGSFGAECHDAPGRRDSTLTRLRCPRLFEIADERQIVATPRHCLVSLAGLLYAVGDPYRPTPRVLHER